MMMKDLPQFGQIDLEEIEYRSEYRFSKTVFASLAIYLWQMPRFIEWLFRGGVWRPLVGGIMLGIFLVMLALLYIIYRSRVVITGNGVTLRRHLLPDIEIPYSEFGEIEFNGMSLTSTKINDQLVTLNLSEASRKWAEKRNSIKISSRDGKKKISIEQGLADFDRFCEDLSTRYERAIERYQGYAKGTIARQPDRLLQTRESYQELSEAMKTRRIETSTPGQ